MAMNKNYKSMRADVRKQAATKKTGGGGTKFNLPEGVTFYNPKKGTERIRVIPYEVTVNNHPTGREPGDYWYERKYSVHFNIGSENKSFVCPKSIGKRCPICEYRARLAKSASPDDEKLKELKPKDRVLYNVHDANGDADNVQLWDFSYHNFSKKLDEEITEGDEELGDFPNPDETGMILSVRFSEKTLGTNTFIEASRIDFKVSDEALSDAMLESAVDLDTVLKVYPFDELEKIFLEMSDEDDTPGEAPSTKSEKSADKKKKVADTQDKEEDAVEAERKRKEQIREAKRKEAEEKKAAEAAAKKGEDNECPGGGTFGVDTDNLKACDNCPKWDACITKKEG